MVVTCNEMNGGISHLRAHMLNKTGQGEPPEDGEVNEMTLPSRHVIRNSSLGGLRPSTLPVGHGGSPQYYIVSSKRRRNICFFDT